MTAYGELIPINVVTGFLGSGKTTLLQRLLGSPALANTAVLVNEFGEIGLDHHLLQGVAEGILLLDNGCVCCALRGDLQASLRQLFSDRERGRVPPFKRVVLETSGLADPVPIAYTLMAEPVLQHHFRLANVIATVDALNGAGQLARYGETRKQAALADRLVLTKTDLAEAGQVAALRDALRALNPAAALLDAGSPALDAVALLAGDAYDDDGRRGELERLMAAEQDDTAGAGHRHGAGIASFTLAYDRPVDWTAFGVWLTLLLHRHGDKVLRVKGLVGVAGLDAPVLINAVQHVVHPPVHLGAWPDAQRTSRLIFILDGLAPEKLKASLATFNALAAS